MQKVVILTSFRDKDDYTKIYKEGVVVEFPLARAEYLKGIGLVDFDGVGVDVGAAPEDEIVSTVGTVEMIDMNLPWQTIVSEVKTCADIKELERALIFETNGKGRKSVLDALQTRIVELANDNKSNGACPIVEEEDK